MSLPSPLSISDQAKLMQAELQSWIAPYNGTAVIASNLRDMWNQAGSQAETPRILICFITETPRGSIQMRTAYHRVDRLWTIAVTQGRGFYLQRGQGLYDNTTTQTPLYDAVEAVRDTVRAMQNISEETPMPDYDGTKAMQLGNLIVDGYTVGIQTANDIPSNIYPH